MGYACSSSVGDKFSSSRTCTILHQRYRAPRGSVLAAAEWPEKSEHHNNTWVCWQMVFCNFIMVESWYPNEFHQLIRTYLGAATDVMATSFAVCLCVKRRIYNVMSDNEVSSVFPRWHLLHTHPSWRAKYMPQIFIFRQEPQCIGIPFRNRSPKLSHLTS